MSFICSMISFKENNSSLPVINTFFRFINKTNRMGSSQSTKLEMLNTVINKTVTDISNSKISTTSVSASIDMTQIIKGNTFKCDQVILEQDSVIDLKVMEEFTSTDTTNFQRSVANAIENAMKSNQGSEMELGALGFSDQKVSQLIRNRVENIMQTSITTEVINNTLITASSNMSQEIIENIIESTGSCKITQNSFIQANINKLTTLITDTIIEDNVLNEIVNEQETEQTAKLTGLAAIIDSIGDILGGPFLIFLLIVAMLVFIVPITGGVVGGGKGFAIAFILIILGIGVYLLIDWLVLSPENSVTKYGNIEAVASDEVDESCGDIWYEEDTQALLKDLHAMDVDETLDEKGLFQKRGEYLYKLADAVICGKNKTSYLKKGIAYDKLYTCLAKNGHINPETMSTVNIITGITFDQYENGTYTSNDIDEYQNEYCIGRGFE